MKKAIIILVFLVSGTSSFSQQSGFYVGLDIPLYYTLGYQQHLTDHFSLNGKVGLLTKPFDVLILDIMKAFDADEVLVNTIGDAFSSGLNIQAIVKWHFKKNYLGLTYSFLGLKAKDCPSDAIENYYGITFRNRRTIDLTLQSNLQNAGLLFGHSFYFKNPAYSVNLELSILKTFYSTSKLKTSSGETIESLSNAVDYELNQYYLEYGFIPSINIYFMYSF